MARLATFQPKLPLGLLRELNRHTLNLSTLPVDGMIRRRWSSGHSGAGVVVADGLDDGGQHAGHHAEHPRHSYDGNSPLDLKQKYLVKINLLRHDYFYVDKETESKRLC